jgi:hypothetical protein
MSKFLDAKAPMTAKCIIRDFLSELCPSGFEEQLNDHTADLVKALSDHGYAITDKPIARTTRRRQPNIG